MMIAFFLSISLFFNILSLFAIVVLFQKQHRLQDLERKQQQALQEMEDLLTSFLYEIKEENEQLQALLQLNPPNSSIPTEDDSVHQEFSSHNQNEQLANDKEAKDISEPTLSLTKQRCKLNEVRKAYKHLDSIGKKEELPPWLKLEEEPLPSNETLPENSLKDQIISLRNAGYPIEAIAKKVNKGKTEVELTLKFYGFNE